MFACFLSYSLNYLVTQEEKLEPIKNTMDDPRIRLLNRLYARKRKELKERNRLKVITTLILHFRGIKSSNFLYPVFGQLNKIIVLEVVIYLHIKFSLC